MATKPTRGAAPKGAETAVTSGAFPGQYQLANNSRIKLALPVVDVLVPAHGVATFQVRDEAQLAALKGELDTLSQLNRLAKDAFVVGPVAAAEAN